MQIRTVLAGAAFAGALIVSVVSPIAQASVPASAAEDSCITWKDAAGPAGAGRYHVRCSGTGQYVQATVNCDDGSTSTSAYRFEYAKAECPSGVKARGGSYRTKYIQ
ncbi:hypothetical protein [Streptomyces flaveolus]|uniref:hypothetical protein n=1 Tax=Streptomyces flaveolus TaxID=67297 RepID=UPI0036F7093C